MIARFDSRSTTFALLLLALVAWFAAVSLAAPQAALAAPETGTFRHELPEQDTHCYVVAPPEVLERRDVPLIIAMHGQGGSAQNFIRTWQSLAEQEGFVAIAPKSRGQSWGTDQGDILAESVRWALEEYPNLSAERVLLTGFSAGGHATLMLGMAAPEIFAALAAVSGCVLEPSTFEAARHMPVYLLVGEDDPNYPGVMQAKQRLEDEDFSVKCDTFPGLAHQYPSDASQRIYRWFMGRATAESLASSVEEAQALLDDGRYAEALRAFEDIARAETPDGIEDADADAIGEAVENAGEQVDAVWMQWRAAAAAAAEAGDEAPADALDAIDKARSYEEREKWEKAAEEYEEIIEDFEGSQGAIYAAARLESILTDPIHGEEVADELAGSKPRTLLRKADRYREREKFDDAREIYEEIVAEYPYTSYARAAREALAEMD